MKQEKNNLATITKKIVFFALLLLPMLLSVPTVLGIDTSSVVSAFHLDNNFTDVHSNKDLSNNGVTFSSSTLKLGTHSAYFGGNDYLTYPSGNFYFGIDSVSFWVKTPSSAPPSDNYFLNDYDGGGTDPSLNMLFLRPDCDIKLRIRGGSYVGSNATFCDGSWHHVVVNGYELVIDNKVIGTATDGGYGANGDMRIGGRFDNTKYLTGYIDEIVFFSGTLTSQNITDLYNSGSGLEYPFGSSATTTTWSIHAIDLYSDSNLSGVNVTFAAGCWNVTDATGFTTVTNQTSGCAGISGTLSWTATKNGYFSASGTVAPNNTATANMYEGVVNITGIYRLVDQALLNASSDWSVETTGGKTYNGNATDYPSNIYLTNGTNTLTLQHAGDYYDKDFTVNITAPQATTTNVSGVYDAVATITAKNVFTNVTISNFTINASNTTYSYESSHSTTNGTLYLPTIQGSNLFLLIDAPGYAYANTTLNATNATPEHEFLLYTMNSIYINIYDADTGLLITQNISVTVSGNTTEETKTTTTGHVYFDLLPDGVYNVKLSGSNYSLRTYSVTVAERSTQTLNAYLSAYTQTVIFTVRDDDTKNSIEGCSLSMYRLVNSSWNVVESKTSDITGRAQFTYTPNIKYRFVTTCEGYIDKEFYLDPIIFSSYNIDMEKTIVLPEDQDYYGVSVTFSPNYFENDKAYNFSITFQSPSGLLSIYNYSITYPSGNASNSGNNAIGETFTTSFNITNATYPSYVVVNYSYNTSIGSWRSFSYRYLVEETIPSHSILELRENDYGLGDFTKALIAVGITIIVAGVAMVVNMMAGAVLGIMVIGYFLYIGFLPLWSVLISFLVIILIIARRSS